MLNYIRQAIHLFHKQYAIKSNNIPLLPMSLIYVLNLTICICMLLQYTQITYKILNPGSAQFHCNCIAGAAGGKQVSSKIVILILYYIEHWENLRFALKHKALLNCT